MVSFRGPLVPGCYVTFLHCYYSSHVSVVSSFYIVKACLLLYPFNKVCARGDGIEVGGLTVHQTIRIRFPAYPNCVWALWWQGGKRRLRTSQCPCQGWLGRLKTPSCSWRWVPGSRSKFGNWTIVPSLYSWKITECDIKPQPTNQSTKFGGRVLYWNHYPSICSSVICICLVWAISSYCHVKFK